MINRTYHSDAIGEDAPVWNGHGNPLNGTECEVSSYEANTFLQCKVLFIGSEHCVLQYPNREEAYHLKHVKFRPLKSERELAIEDIVNYIKVPASVFVGGSDRRIAENIFDAGYRKIKDAEK